jgi:hypothetical protein
MTMRNMIKRDVALQGCTPSDVDLGRFLTANKGDVEKGFAQYKNAAVWRMKNVEGQSKYTSKLPVHNDYFATRLFCCFHGLDRLGRPLVIERMGHIPYDAMLAEVTEEHLIERHIWQMEELMRRCDYAAKNTGSGSHQFVLILDLKDFKLQLNNKKLSMFKAVLGIDANYYPETLGKMFIINAPFMFRSIWAMVSGLVDAKTKTKIQMLSQSEMRKILEVVDPSQLPCEYGGVCNSCRPGYNCCPDINEPYIPSRMNVLGNIVQEEKPEPDCESKSSSDAAPATDGSVYMEVKTTSSSLTVVREADVDGGHATITTTTTTTTTSSVIKFSQDKYVPPPPRRMKGMPAGVMRGSFSRSNSNSNSSNRSLMNQESKNGSLRSLRNPTSATSA